MTSKNYALAAASMGLLLSIVLLLLPVGQHAPHAFAANLDVTATPTVDKGKGPVVGSSITFTDPSTSLQDTATVRCADTANNIVGEELIMPAGSGFVSQHDLIFMPIDPGASSSRTYCAWGNSSTFPCSSSTNSDHVVQCAIGLDQNGGASDITASLAGQTDQELEAQDELDEGQNSTNHVGEINMSALRNGMVSLISNSGGSTIWNLQIWDRTQRRLRTLSIQETSGSLPLINQFRNLVNTLKNYYTLVRKAMSRAIYINSNVITNLASPGLRMSDVLSYVFGSIVSLPPDFYINFAEVENTQRDMSVLFIQILNQQQGSPIELTPRSTSPAPTPTP
jgi:hypothetical protein